jgi:hypothetical protein
MSGPSFTRGEYWLLESAVEGTPPFQWLLSANLDEIFNKPGHGLARGALVDTLERLVGAGLVCAHREAGDDFAPTRVEIEAALDESTKQPSSQRTYYGLTPVGGAAWEAFAAPDWNRLIDSSFDEDSRYEVICADRKLLERYLAALRREGTFDESTLVWDEMSPWAATYWKDLPLGHRARFTFVDDVERRPPVTSMSQWFSDWYRWR